MRRLRTVSATLLMATCSVTTLSAVDQAPLPVLDSVPANHDQILVVNDMLKLGSAMLGDQLMVDLATTSHMSHLMPQGIPNPRAMIPFLAMQRASVPDAVVLSADQGAWESFASMLELLELGVWATAGEALDENERAAATEPLLAEAFELLQNWQTPDVAVSISFPGPATAANMLARWQTMIGVMQIEGMTSDLSNGIDMNISIAALLRVAGLDEAALAMTAVNLGLASGFDDPRIAELPVMLDQQMVHMWVRETNGTLSMGMAPQAPGTTGVTLSLAIIGRPTKPPVRTAWPTCSGRSQACAAWPNALLTATSGSWLAHLARTSRLPIARVCHRSCNRSRT